MQQNKLAFVGIYFVQRFPWTSCKRCKVPSNTPGPRYLRDCGPAHVHVRRATSGLVMDAQEWQLSIVRIVHVHEPV